MSVPDYLTTREVADLLRVKERKVYDLAAAGEIPHRRITGKLLFPRDALHAWIDGEARDAARPPVLAGSHDPLLDWAVRESGSGLATLFDGSLDGLERYGNGQAALTGLHLPDDAGWNVGAVAALGLGDCVLIGWAVRRRGLLVAPGTQDIASIGDLAGRRVVLRQPGAGTAALMTRLMAGAGLGADAICPTPGYARTESEAAATVAAGEADAAFGLAAMARQFGLGFVALTDERFDLLIDRRCYFTDPVQRLLRFAGSEACAAKAEALGGYDMSALGTVRWLSP